ncbi:MAG: hypothetical protein EOP51_03835 [Sphingobacteriales bacterium]|nr:MAG: hypothetical protein EOP51_03835 [Sphingobacteriales bacterium]
MAKIVQRKLDASSLIEVLVAMVIIMVVFTIAMSVFSNLMYTGVSITKIKVQYQLQLLTNKVKIDGYVKSEHEIIDSIDYFMDIDTSSIPGFSKLSIKASQHNRTLGQTTYLFIVNDNPSEN